MPPPRYFWDEGQGRYRTADGRFLAEATVRSGLDTVLDASSRQMRALAAELQQGRLTVAEWQAAMTGPVKQAQILGAVSARGGWDAMTPSDWGAVGARTKAQYTYLAEFAAQIADGRQPLDGALLRRAELYGQAGRGAYEAERGRMAGDRGLTHEVNVLGGSQHCQDCLNASARGYVPIGTLPPIGARRCVSNCRCRLQYANRGAA